MLPSPLMYKAEVSPQGSFEAEKVLPRARLQVLMPRRSLASPLDRCLGSAFRPDVVASTSLVSSALPRLEASKHRSLEVTSTISLFRTFIH